MLKQQSITACTFLHKGGKLFVAKRAKTKSFLPDIFEIPGGHIEFGETLEDGLRREIMEEFHIDIIVQNVFHAFTYVSGNGAVHTIEVDYFAVMKDPAQEIQLNPHDHSEYAWVTKEEVDKYFDAKDQVKEIIDKGFNLLDMGFYLRTR